MKKILFPVLLFVVLMASCRHEEEMPGVITDVYFPQVKTIIHNNCLTCHIPGGQGMPVVLVSDSDIVNLAASIKAATTDPVSPFNKRMPQGGELSDADKDIILKWFEKGGTAGD